MTRDTDLIRRALLNIREISMTLEDEYGNPWVESHMIEREVAAALAALSAPVQEPPTPAPVVPAEGLEGSWRCGMCDGRFPAPAVVGDHGDVPSCPFCGTDEIERSPDPHITAPRSAPPVGARVRPLVWEPCEAWKRCSKERAKAFGGEYQIVMLDPDDDPPLPSLYFEIGLGAFMFRFEQGPDPLGLPGETCPRTFPSVEAAKAAAQADYEARILAALLPAGEGE